MRVWLQKTTWDKHSTEMHGLDPRPFWPSVARRVWDPDQEMHPWGRHSTDWHFMSRPCTREERAHGIWARDSALSDTISVKRTERGSGKETYQPKKGELKLLCSNLFFNYNI